MKIYLSVALLTLMLITSKNVLATSTGYTSTSPGPDFESEDRSSYIYITFDNINLDETECERIEVYFEETFPDTVANCGIDNDYGFCTCLII